MTFHHFLILIILALLVIIFLFLIRIIRGPDIFDRLVGLNGIATKTVLFLVILGAFLNQLDMLIDIAIGYGLLNLVGSLAVGKYLEQKK